MFTLKIFEITAIATILKERKQLVNYKAFTYMNKCKM